jgi:hypothetical protein
MIFLRKNDVDGFRSGDARVKTTLELAVEGDDPPEASAHFGGRQQIGEVDAVGISARILSMTAKLTSAPSWVGS